ncbi:MAG: hypothetical protein PHS88_07555, partial [Candidatus Omnitrophica bacterium]|nr:hypothetical protein [Candidatus Omnitrophota bacterium]
MNELNELKQKIREIADILRRLLHQAASGGSKTQDAGPKTCLPDRRSQDQRQGHGARDKKDPGPKKTQDARQGHGARDEGIQLPVILSGVPRERDGVEGSQIRDPSAAPQDDKVVSLGSW